MTIGSKQYNTKGKLDAFAQLHLARKLAPALPIIEGMVDAKNAEKEKSLLTVLMLSHISDADSEFVMKKCLSVVGVRQSDGKYANLQTSDGKLMFDDTPMQDILELAVAVIEENLGDFFRTSLASLAEQAKAQTQG